MLLNVQYRIQWNYSMSFRLPLNSPHALKFPCNQLCNRFQFTNLVTVALPPQISNKREVLHEEPEQHF